MGYVVNYLISILSLGMGSAKQEAAISTVMAMLQEWDKGSRTTRRQILQDFIAQNYTKTGPELEAEFAQAASLFLTRLTAWLRLTYPFLLTSQVYLRSIYITINK